MGEIAEATKLTQLCTNCNHLGTFHAKLNIKREKTRSWEYTECRECKKEGKKCLQFNPSR